LVKLALRYLTGLNIGGGGIVEKELVSRVLMVRCCEGDEAGSRALKIGVIELHLGYLA
jgi:hypothetical protein